MATTKPNVDPDGLYNRAQASAALGVERHTVKRYEENGHIYFKVRKAGGQKITTGKQIIKCGETTYL